MEKLKTGNGYFKQPINVAPVYKLRTFIAITSTDTFPEVSCNLQRMMGPCSRKSVASRNFYPQSRKDK